MIMETRCEDQIRPTGFLFILTVAILAAASAGMAAIRAGIFPYISPFTPRNPSL